MKSIYDTIGLEGARIKRFNPWRVGSDRARRRLQWKAAQAERAPFIVSFSRRATDVRQQIVRRIAARLRGQRSFAGTQDLVVDVMQREGVEEIRNLLIGIHQQTGRVFAERAVNAIEQKHLLLARKQVEDQWMDEVLRWFRQEGGTEIRRVSSTVRRDIMETIARMREEGKGMEEIARQLEKEQEGIDRQRGRVIARTEVITGSNRGSLFGAKQSAVDVVKAWLDSNDSRVRRQHEATDGQIRELDAAFDVTGHPAQYPGDPQLPGHLRIQCRCTVTFEPKDGGILTEFV